MPTLKFDRNATGTGSGGSWLNAISDQNYLLNNNFSNTSGGTVRLEFANGDNPWAFTKNKTEVEGTERLEIVGVDPGNGSTQKPRFTCYTPHSVMTGWTEVNPNYIVYPNLVNGGAASVVGQPGSNCWWRSSGPSMFAGAFRDTNGNLVWGRRVRMIDNSSGANYSAPSANYNYGDVQGGGNGPGGFCVYWDGVGDPSGITFLRRPSLVTDVDVWVVNRPLGGLEVSGLEFYENDFAFNVQNSTSNSLIDNVWIHDNNFVRCRKGFAAFGTGAQYNGSNRTNAGFRGLIFERNFGFELGQMLFHAWGSVCVNDALIRGNWSRYNNLNEGSGTYYFDSAYTTGSSWAQVYMNWIDAAAYDGRYWDDGSAFYSEFGSHGMEYWGNLVTNTKIGCHLNIGQGFHRFRNNIMRSNASSSTGMRIVNAVTNGVTERDTGQCWVQNNIFDRFSVAIGIINYNFTNTPVDRTLYYIHRNIMRGRLGIDANYFFYAMQGNSGCFSNARMGAYKNNLTDFYNPSPSDYSGRDNYGSGAGKLSDAAASTSRVSATSVMDTIPVPHATRTDINYALMAPTDIGTQTGTTTALRAGKPALLQT